MDKLPSHYVNSVWYAFKVMVGGKRFYLGKKLGIVDDSNGNAKKAQEAASVYRRAFDRLQATGVKEWTPEALEAAEATVRAVLLGIPVQTPTVSVAGIPYPPTPIAIFSEAAKGAGGHSPYTQNSQTLSIPATASVVPATASVANGLAGITLHTAMDIYLAEQLTRYEVKDIVYNTYSGYKDRLKAVRLASTDIPLSQLGRDQLTLMVNYWKKRPITIKGKPASVGWVKCVVAALRDLLQWAYDTERWDSFRAWEKCLELDVEKYLTPSEKKADRDNGADKFTIAELAIIYANSPDRLKLYILLGLNCGAGATEQATLRTWDVELAAFGDILQGKGTGVIDRTRNKTGVPARWTLWKETAQLLAEAMSLSHDKISPKEEAHYKRQAPREADWETLAVLTEDGYPLVHRSGVKMARCDAVYQAFARVLNKPAVKGKVRRLDFYAFRRTAAQMVRDIAGYEVHKVFGAWSTLEASGRKSVSESHYSERTEADFAKVNIALQEMRKRLEPMFSAKAEPVAVKVRGPYRKVKKV